MNEKEILIEQIKKYGNIERYSIESFVNFIQNKAKINSFFQQKIQNFICIKEKYPIFALKYSSDICKGEVELNRIFSYKSVYVKTNHTKEELLEYIQNDRLLNFMNQQANTNYELSAIYNHLKKKIEEDVRLNEKIGEWEKLKFKYNHKEQQIIKNLEDSLSLLFYALQNAIDVNKQNKMPVENTTDHNLSYYYFLYEKDENIRQQIIDEIINNCILADNVENRNPEGIVLPEKLNSVTEQCKDVYTIFYKNPSTTVRAAVDDYNTKQQHYHISESRMNDIIVSLCQRLGLLETNLTALRNYINQHK